MLATPRIPQRSLELVWARRNTVRLRRQGAIEVDAEGYPFFVLLHAGWLASPAVFVPASTPPFWPLLGLFALLQLGRLWVLASLGRYWTTRVITLPGAPVLDSQCSPGMAKLVHPRWIRMSHESTIPTTTATNASA